MKELMECNYCNSLISDTALLCPICLKTQQEKHQKNDSAIGEAMVFGAAAIIFNPIVVACVLADSIRESKIIKQAKNLAKTCGAIDAFYLTDMLILVTNLDFIFLLEGITLGVTGPAIISKFKIPRNKIREVYIDEKRSCSGGLFKSSKTSLCLKETAGILVESAHYEFKGKNSRELAEFACAKFQEYWIRG